MTYQEETVKTKLYATDLMDFIYCKRLLYLQKMRQAPTMDNAASVSGTFEHEVRRTAIKFLEPEYGNCSNLAGFKGIDYFKSLRDALDYALDLGQKRYPEFIHNIELMMPELYTRLVAEEKRRVDLAVRLASKGVDPRTIRSRVLPWAVELGVGDSILGVTGRIDQVYKCNNSLTPIDFKTHTNRFSSWIWREAHSEQIAVYALLLELQYRGHKVKSGFIKYTQDLYDHFVKLPKDNKSIIISHIEQARTLLGGRIPQRLQGQDAIKCNHCHLKESCFRMTDSEAN